MASDIPVSVPAPTVKTNGIDIVDADHINYVQNDIIAFANYIGMTGAAQSHSAALLPILQDSYIGWRVYKKDNDEIYIDAGAGIVANVAGTIRELKRITSVTTLTASDLDTGSFVVGYYYVYVCGGNAATTPVFKISASASAPTGYTVYRKVGWFYNETINILDITGGKISTFIGGNNDIQIIKTQTGAYAACATLIPTDDTIPQKTEGNEVMTLTIIPTNASNKLKIDVVINGAPASGGYVCAALFQDDIADALACSFMQCYSSYTSVIKFTHFMDAGTIVATTFKVRVGHHSASFNFNGDSGARKYGGVIASSITITEIKA